jgi:hypothetical protein
MRQRLAAQGEEHDRKGNGRKTANRRDKPVIAMQGLQVQTRRKHGV